MKPNFLLIMSNFTYLLSLLIRICFATARQKYVLPDLLLACYYLDIQPGLSLYCVIMNTLICSSVGKHLGEHFGTLSPQT